MRKAQVALLGFALLGWGVCGATIGVGRHFLPMQTTLILHAIVAPLAFWVLGWTCGRWFPQLSARRIGATMFAVAAGLDAFLVAPFIEHSFAMFHSWLGTWLPLVLSLVAAYAGARRADR